ncbi:MAG: hypothetical protein ACTSWW_06325 [Promethearchaeota archaeon]
MKKRSIVILTGYLIIGLGWNMISQAHATPPQSSLAAPIIADHTTISWIMQDLISDEDVNQTKDTLHIAYGHTSHGSQITTGMLGLPAFKEGNGGAENLYDWNEGGTNDALDLDDYFVSGDLGGAGDTAWAVSTRNYLDNPIYSDVNVVMWSWCGGVSENTEDGINIYLSAMDSLENDYPNVYFIYMTGHADGTGVTGNLHIRNQQIREYCVTNYKILFDFYDIECHNPDGDYFGDKAVTDNCDYDDDGDGSRESNWATEWQDSHTENEDWYDCEPAHSQALNGNVKAFAAWWLFVSISKTINEEPLPTSTTSTTDPTSTTSDPTTTTSDPTTDPSDDPDPSKIAGFSTGSLLFTTVVVFGIIFHKSKKCT